MIGIPGLSISRRRRRASFTGAYDAVPSIVAAYGMRRLRTAYTGSLLRMRRSSDNAESDFGYTSAGHLDTAAIVAWLSGSGYIVKWYDQSGNGYDATQSTAASQPLYVASGQNGRPVLRWDGVNDYVHASTPSLSQTNTVMLTIKSSATGRSIIDGGFEANRQQIVHNASGNIELNGGTIFDTGTIFSLSWIVLCSVFAGVSSLAYKNGVATSSGNAGTHAIDDLVIGSYFAALAAFANADIAELIICNAALSTGDRQAAESAANDYWGIY